MKKLLSILFVLSAFFVQGQTNGYPPKINSNGNWYNRLRADSAQHVPHKYGLTQNTTDSTPQIFVWTTIFGDSLIWFVNGRYHIAAQASSPGSVVANNGSSTGIGAGLFSGRPTATNCQCYYFATDSARMYYDNGSWIAFIGGSGGGGGGGPDSAVINATYLKKVVVGTNIILGLDTAAYRKMDSLYTVTDSTFGYFLNGTFHSFKLRGLVMSPGLWFKIVSGAGTVDTAAAGSYFFRRTDIIPSANLPTVTLGYGRGLSATVLGGIPSGVLGMTAGQVLDSAIYISLGNNFDFTLDSLGGHFKLKRLNAAVAPVNMLGRESDSSARSLSPAQVVTFVNPTATAGQLGTIDPGGSGVMKGHNLIVHIPVHYVTKDTLPANTYNNGTAGVGATLTGNTNRFLIVDGDTTALNDRILVNNEVNQTHAGIYKVTTKGDASHAYVLTRTDYGSISADMGAGSMVYVDSGLTRRGAVYIQTTTGTITFGTTPLNYITFNVQSPFLYNYANGKLSGSGGGQGVFADSTLAVYLGIIRSSSAAGIGQPVTHSYIIDPQHSSLGFTSAISASGPALGLFIPTCQQIYFVGVCDDEVTQAGSLSAGASFQLSQVLIQGSYPILNQGGRIVGNGTSTPDVTALDGGWTPTFSGGNSVFMDYGPPSFPNYNAITMTYQGNNNWHMKRSLTSLGSHNTVFVCEDAGGNAVPFNAMTSTDVITMTGNGTLAVKALQWQTVDQSNKDLFTSGFENIWVCAFVSINPNTPGRIVPVTATTISSSAIDIAWSASTGAASYTVKRSTSPHDPTTFSTVFTGSALIFHDTGLTTGTKYYYWVEATNNLGPAGALLESGFEAVNATTL